MTRPSLWWLGGPSVLAIVQPIDPAWAAKPGLCECTPRVQLGLGPRSGLLLVRAWRCPTLLEFFYRYRNV
eukprot:5178750-Prymnesium_polylepis.1